MGLQFMGRGPRAASRFEDHFTVVGDLDFFQGRSSKGFVMNEQQCGEERAVRDPAQHVCCGHSDHLKC